ncbi:MAG: hypothetical protein ACOCVT_00640 [bacterium]
MITITPQKALTKPLETIRVETGAGLTIRIYDGAGRLYGEGEGPELELIVAGALGYHTVVEYDSESNELNRASFKVDCESDIRDDSGRYQHLLKQCLHKCLLDIHRGGPNTGNVHLLDDHIHRGFVLTSRDHIHGHKAMRYFIDWNREWIDAFCEHQREDGMVWDFFSHRGGREKTHFEVRWPEDFTKVVANGDSIFARQPVMNDLEHMFIRGIWQTWRTTGDDAWMASRLDNALRALDYATSSPYMWSDKFGLVRRPCCIDMWDFQSDFDSAVVGGDHMLAIPGVSKYGAMHGDSMGLAQACDELVEMLEHAGRQEEAERVRKTGENLRENLDTYCWNGEFFTHFVPEDPDFERDFGVDQSEQVSLSNSYALNRGIPHEQAVAIIKTYQRLRKETEGKAPGEWFCMYPPFRRGFGNHGMWHYVNGGVSPMVAGELAHGAFEHGFEEYGVDILNRVAELGVKYDTIPRVWRGMLPEEPKRDFETIDLRTQANTGFSGTEKTNAIPWTDEGDNDFHEMPVGKQKLQTIDFDVIDPATNDGAACVGISMKEPYLPKLQVPVGRMAASLYFLHTLSGGATLAGDLTIHYADGSIHRMYVRRGTHIQGWWMPRQEIDESRFDPTMLVAWRGGNAHCSDIGAMVWGLDNPHPDKEIASLEMHPAMDGAIWFILGITLSDAPVYLPPSGLSMGIPAPWSVGAVIWSMFEGLSGVYDTSPNFKTARIAPRWAASDSKNVTVTAKYEEGGGYVCYNWARKENELRLVLTASSDEVELELLLPKDCVASTMEINDKAVDYETRTIEDSEYACTRVSGTGAFNVLLKCEKK